MKDTTPEPRSLTVAIDHRFVSVGDDVYTDLAFATPYWTQYLATYREVIVFARVGRRTQVPSGYVRADDHPLVSFSSAGEFQGVVQILLSLPALLLKAARVARSAEAALVRNGAVSTSLWIFLVLLRRPYGKEVQGDIGESIRLTVSGGSWVTGALARLADSLTRAQTGRAAAVAYVTPVLARQYPPSKHGTVVHYSSIGLPGRPEVDSRRAQQFRKPTTLISVGRLEREKGHDLLIKALAELSQEADLEVNLRLVGDGTQRPSLEMLCRSLHLEGRVVFTGLLAPGDAVHREIDGADLFVLPSRIEGTPRALLEAMARGLPCVGTRVGGVPELLPEGRLANGEDEHDLARVIGRALREDAAALSAADQERAFDLYGEEVMNTNWRRFHEAITHV